jgi:uncharacterized protein YggL (DUF469 family)
MDHLPEDVLQLILSFMPPITLVRLNKEMYCRHHQCIKPLIKGSFLNYVRATVERDHDFVFTRILKENIDAWLLNRQYMYKGMVFNNYIYLINYICIEQHSEQCRELVQQHLEDRNLRQNLHKKNIVKYISNRFSSKWTN